MSSNPGESTHFLSVTSFRQSFVDSHSNDWWIPGQLFAPLWASHKSGNRYPSYRG
ncbi:uncharacterized protein HfgLR_05880 [Haloferax gibbonsii]|uniref:Uncharacterized protein n=1 Tax=Haloferax gibbonsii TaxID=35746 RepID=A0A871BEV5_HALGI|nr:uncharacterized protein HfgLR_05880 [Haloferax gibbonsii]